MIDELHLEVRQVETGIIVTVELICKVKDNLVSLALPLREQKLLHQAITNVLHLRMRSYETVKSELNLARCVQVSYTFVLVRYQYAL